MSTPDPAKTPQQYEAEGMLLVDLPGSRFDHHIETHDKKTECASTLVAKYLGIINNPELKKVLMFAKRDDLEGKGTISIDPLDRAFGLPGIIMSMNRVHVNHPNAILDLVISIYEAHVYEEYKRTVEMPQEWKELKAQGIAKEVVVPAMQGPMLLVYLTSDNTSLPGFIRAYRKADVVVQRRISGHTNILTRQDKDYRLDLRPIISRIRVAEAKAGSVTLAADTVLDKPGKVDGVPEWYYDTAANTLQNGGVNPQGVPATKLSLEEIARLVQEGMRE